MINEDAGAARRARALHDVLVPSAQALLHPRHAIHTHAYPRSRCILPRPGSPRAYSPAYILRLPRAAWSLHLRLRFLKPRAFKMASRPDTGRPCCKWQSSILRASALAAAAEKGGRFNSAWWWRQADATAPCRARVERDFDRTRSRRRARDLCSCGHTRRCAREG